MIFPMIGCFCGVCFLSRWFSEYDKCVSVAKKIRADERPGFGGFAPLSLLLSSRVHLSGVVLLLLCVQDHYTAMQPGLQRMVLRLEELVQRIDGEGPNFIVCVTAFHAATCFAVHFYLFLLYCMSRCASPPFSRFSVCLRLCCMSSVHPM